MKNLLTGISGYLGQALTKRLLDEGHEVVGLARNEKLLKPFAEKYGIEPIYGDVANSYAVEKAGDIDGIFHLAAFKHVRDAENQVMQCCLSNIGGTINILYYSFRKKPKFVIGISTDKAAKISGVYGKTKSLMEDLFREAEAINPDTKYRIVRYGNVWASTGSIGDIWPQKMKRGEEITLTDPEMTRFFWPVEDAIDHIFECLERAKDSTPYTPEMKAVKMGTVVEAMQEVYGKCPIKVIGLQKGENMHETMDGVIFSNEVPQFTKKEFIKKFLNG